MAKRYTNLDEVDYTNTFEDRFKERRMKGSTHPTENMPSAPVSYKRDFLDDCLYVSWMGHSSMFIHMETLNILIDPINAKYASPVQFMGPKRFKQHVWNSDDLPDIDLILITHNHYDHLDKHIIQSLKHKTAQYITPKGVGKYLKHFGVEQKRIIELDWFESFKYQTIEITLTPSRHFSSRYLIDQNTTLWGGYVLKGNDFTVYDSGDGGYGKHFKDIHERFKDVDIAILECGQYNVRWHDVHMFPEESVEAGKLLNARLSIPVHWGGYNLSDHYYYEPVTRFEMRAKEKDLNYKIPVLYDWIVIEKKN